MQLRVTVDSQAIDARILVGPVAAGENLELDDIVEWHWVVRSEDLVQVHFLRVDPVDYLVLDEGHVFVDS